ncbi:membrane protein [Pelistega indica]|uniref:Membrane protein n=1 Tax=Pelistega indica TaxID=1414851 RepID=V8G463_9BURK|nr:MULTISPECIES: EamA family transporter [Pelistega]ETD70748.1 membrane protein [Pelistega indica]
MPLRDWLAALLTIIVWGLNFLISKIGLAELPPLLFGGIRVFMVAFPAIFFLKPPKAPWKLIIAYGTTINFLQFAFMLSSLAFGLSGGLTSLLMQMQAFFTIIFAALYFKEKIPLGSLIAIFIAFLGITLLIQGANTETVIPFLGLICVVGAAISWACGNITIKLMREVNMVSLVVWGGLISTPMFMLASYIFEGPERIASSLSNASINAYIAAAYSAYMSNLVGYVLWGRLLATRPVNLIAPLTLLVPIVGIISNAIAFHEKLSVIQWFGVITVMLALIINVFWLKIVKFFKLSLNPHKN